MEFQVLTEIIRQNLIYIPEWELYIHYGMTVFTAIIYILWFYRTFKKLDLNWKKVFDYMKNHWWKALKNLILYGVLQRKVIRDRYAGIMHILIFYGILILTISTALVALDNDILKPFGYRILVGDFYLLFETFSDLGGLMLLSGLTMALYRRLRKKVKLHTIWDDYIVIASLYIIAFEGFFLEGLNVHLENVMLNYGYVNSYRFLGTIFSYAYSGISISLGIEIYRILWFVHFMTVFTVLIYALNSKLSHVILSPTYVAVRKDKVRGEMTTPFSLEEAMQTGNFEFKFGVKSEGDLNSINKLMSLACTDCGRCERACPAFAAGRELSPRLLMQSIKSRVGTNSILTPDVFSDEFLWSCTTCQACVEECPVLIDPQSLILEMRRTVVLESRLDKQKVQFLNNLTYTRNPLGNSPSERNEWIDKAGKYADQEYLLWVGCMASFDPRTKKVMEDLIYILKKANVSFGVLGEEEACCGESARRLGEESRFQELVLQNIETFKKYNVKKIITICPHGYNTFKNEYKKFYDGLEVYHHTQIIWDLIEKNRLNIKKDDIKFTYHDPCYLGRINGEFDRPRFILNKAVDIVEMERSKSKSFCCGGGGANYWYKVQEKEPINQIRLKEAVGKSNNVAVACPFCLGMLEDASRTLGMEENVKVMDIAEIVRSHLSESESGSTSSR